MDERPQPPLATEADYGAPPPTAPAGNPEDFGVPEVQENGEAAPMSNFTVPSTPVEIPDQINASSEGLGEWDAGNDGAPIPPRVWLLGTVLCRRFVSSLVAEGDVGKTALRTAQALALATGQPITGEHVFQRCRALIVSLEDDIDELRRRVRAARLHHGISQDDVRGWLFLATPDAAAGKIMIADSAGQPVRSNLADTIETCIVKRAIDFVTLDPYVKCHAVEENNNTAMDGVVQILANMAAKHDIAFDTPHPERRERPRQCRCRARR